MALRLTKTNKIVFAISIVLLSSVLGFLVWRVNQQESVAPEDIEARECNYGSDCTNKCYWPETAYCTRGYQCTCMSVTDQQKDPGWNPCTDTQPRCTPVCKSGQTTAECSARCSSCNNLYYVSIRCEEPPPPENICEGGNWITRPTGEVEYGADIVFSVRNTDPDGVGTRTAKLCTGALAICTDGTNVPTSLSGNDISGSLGNLNPNTYTLTVEWKDGLGNSGAGCLQTTTFTVSEEPVVNVCTGGIWKTEPKGSYDFGVSIPFVAENTDVDGIGTWKEARLCTGTLSKCTAGTVQSTSVNGNLISGTLTNLNPNTYTLTVSWEDGALKRSEACTLTATFTVLEVPTNPDWTVTKSVQGECIDENTPNPSAKLSYEIYVKNVGDGSGTVTRVEDSIKYKGSSLPSGLQPINILPSGTYSSSKITWAGKAFNSNDDQTYTYEIIVPKEYFGLYTNTVTVVVDGDDPQASASIDISCGEYTPEGTIPETGIFDSTLGKIFSGALLLAIGVFVYTLPNKVFFFTGKPLSYKYRDRFEKKVAKR